MSDGTAPADLACEAAVDYASNPCGRNAAAIATCERCCVTWGLCLSHALDNVPLVHHIETLLASRGHAITRLGAAPVRLEGCGLDAVIVSLI